MDKKSPTAFTDYYSWAQMLLTIYFCSHWFITSVRGFRVTHAFFAFTFCPLILRSFQCHGNFEPSKPISGLWHNIYHIFFDHKCRRFRPKLVERIQVRCLFFLRYLIFLYYGVISTCHIFDYKCRRFWPVSGTKNQYADFAYQYVNLEKFIKFDIIRLHNSSRIE